MDTKQNKDSRVDALAEAVVEAHRFLAAAELASDDLMEKKRLHSSRAYAAAKRASMDLSNALVKVRSPAYP